MVCLSLAVLHPEYGIQIWGLPQFKKDVEMLERATKMFSDLKHITEKDTLRDLALV